MGSRRRRREATGAFDDIIPELYDALFQPQAWPVVLSRVADAAGVSGVHFFFADAVGVPVMSGASERITKEVYGLYRDHYCTMDPRRDATLNLPLGEFMLCHRVFDEDYVRRSEFFNDFCLRVGFRYLAGVCVFHEEGHDALLGFHKSVGAEPFVDREVRELRTLLPHFRRLAQLQHRLESLEAGVRPLALALDRLASGVIIVDQDLRIRFVNHAAEGILRAQDGLAQRNNRLAIAHAATSDALHRLIAQAAQCAAGEDPHKGGGGLAVHRPSGRRSLLLLVVPLPVFAAACVWRPEPAVMLLITDPEAQARIPATRFAELFGLTPAETRLAESLAAGDSLAEAADKFGLSKHTLRVQLRALMAKTETNRQAALVRLLVASSQLVNR
jgi:DNA-binding CsgD family transcriptional regulator/PAS domain-containing protein